MLRQGKNSCKPLTTSLVIILSLLASTSTSPFSSSSSSSLSPSSLVGFFSLESKVLIFFLYERLFSALAPSSSSLLLLLLPFSLSELLWSDSTAFRFEINGLPLLMLLLLLRFWEGPGKEKKDFGARCITKPKATSNWSPPSVSIPVVSLCSMDSTASFWMAVAPTPPTNRIFWSGPGRIASPTLG